MDPTNANTALASAMVEELARCGVRHAALAPGSRSAPLALALWREPAIEVTVVVDERSAGFLALGAAQATGVPAAVLTTSGTAAANLHPAICEADESGVPLLALTADRPPELRGIGAGQTIDQLKLYGEAVRWFCEVGTHAADDAGLLHFRAVACRAFAAASGDPRPGPVHLNVPWRDPLGPEAVDAAVTASSRLALEGRGTAPLTAVGHAAAQAPPALIAEVVETIAAVPRGLIVAGRQRHPGLASAIDELARASGYPVLAEPTSQVRFGPVGAELAAWPYEPIARARPDELAPEVVIRFGELPTCKPLREWLGDLDRCVQVVVDANHGWNEPTRRAELVLRSDADPFVAAVVAGLRPNAAGDNWARTWLDATSAAAIAIERELRALDSPTEPGLHSELGRLYGDGDLVYTASSMPIRDQEAFVAPSTADVTFLANRGANGIDGLVSSGVGAAIASGRPTWIVTGDLGLFHDMNGLATLRDVETPVRIVVANNDGGGIFEFLPQAEQVERHEFEAILGTPLGLELERVAALHRLRYERIERLDDLESAAGTDRVLIEVPVPDRRRNVELHRRISEAAVAAVRDSLAG